MSEPPAKSASGRDRKPTCPICGKPQVTEHRPFCSARCRDVDLHRWLNESYAIPVVQDDESLDEAAEEEDAGNETPPRMH